MKYLVSIFLIGLVIAWFFITSEPVTVVSNSQSSTSVPLPSSSAPDNPIHNKTEKVVVPHAGPNPTAIDNTQNLSPQMKQALKDKLLHHGPKTITKDDNGRIRLDSAGRYTNMPVAVRQADGSIKIKEYSVVPETNAEPK